MTSKLLFASVMSFLMAAPLLRAIDDPPDKPDDPVRLKKKDKPNPPVDKPGDKKAEPGDKKTPPPDKKAELPKKKTDAKDEGDPEAQDPEKDAKQILARVTKNMRTSEDRLDKKDPGDATQQVQRDILKDLDSLIEESKKQQQQNQQNSRRTMRQRNQKNQRDSQSAQDRKSKEEQEAEAQRNAQKKAGQANQNSAANNPGAGGKSKEDKSKNEDLYKDRWGELPETLRQELLTYSREKFMMKYQDLIKQYYTTLAEKNRKKE